MKFKKISIFQSYAKNDKEPSIKDGRSQGRGWFVQCGHFADKGVGSSDADVHTFWRKNLSIFRNL